MSCRTVCKQISLKLARSEPIEQSRLDYHVWGAMLVKYHKLQPRRKVTGELNVALQSADHLGSD